MCPSRINLDPDSEREKGQRTKLSVLEGADKSSLLALLFFLVQKLQLCIIYTYDLTFLLQSNGWGTVLGLDDLLGL